LYEAVKHANRPASFKQVSKLVYYAVPDSDSINEIITTSLVQYIQNRLINLAGFNGKMTF
jgi:hypothetical protein